MAEQAAPAEGAPASPQAEPQVQIELGPHDIYPETARPTPEPEPEAEPDEALEPDDEAVTPPEPVDAGVQAEAPEAKQPRRSRRQAGEEAYQRGLSEGRERAQQELREQQQQQLSQQAQREANERIQALFRQLNAPTYQQREEAGKQLAAIHAQTLQGNQALEVARAQVYNQMAADFQSVKELEGATEADMQDLLKSTSMSEYAKKVHAIGRRALEDRITKLEAELQSARVRTLAGRSTPEPANGAGRIGSTAMHDLQSMSLKEIRKLEGTPEYDRMVAQHLADLAAGRIS